MWKSLKLNQKLLCYSSIQKMSQWDLLSFLLLCAHCIFLLLKFWPIYNAGCWCAFLRTIKVALRVSGHRVPRHPRNLAVHQTARMSCKAVCTTDGWSVELLFLSFGTVTVSHHHSHLRARGVVCLCVCVYLFGSLGLDVQQVNVSMFAWCLTWIMYEHMKFWWRTWTQPTVDTQFCTKHIESMFQMFCRNSLVYWNTAGKATLKQ